MFPIDKFLLATSIILCLQHPIDQNSTTADLVKFLVAYTFCFQFENCHFSSNTFTVHTIVSHKINSYTLNFQRCNICKISWRFLHLREMSLSGARKNVNGFQSFKVFQRAFFVNMIKVEKSPKVVKQAKQDKYVVKVRGLQNTQRITRWCGSSWVYNVKQIWALQSPLPLPVIAWSPPHPPVPLFVSKLRTQFVSQTT